MRCFAKMLNSAMSAKAKILFQPVLNRRFWSLESYSGFSLIIFFHNENFYFVIFASDIPQYIYGFLDSSPISSFIISIFALKEASSMASAYSLYSLSSFLSSCLTCSSRFCISCLSSLPDNDSLGAVRNCDIHIFFQAVFSGHYGDRCLYECLGWEVRLNFRRRKQVLC